MESTKLTRREVAETYTDDAWAATENGCTLSEQPKRYLVIQKDSGDAIWFFECETLAEVAHEVDDSMTQCDDVQVVDLDEEKELYIERRVVAIHSGEEQLWEAYRRGTRSVEIRQGELLPGRTDAICAAIITAEDIQQAGSDGDKTLTREDACAYLAEQGDRISNVLLYDWCERLSYMQSLTDQVAAAGQPLCIECGEDTVPAGATEQKCAACEGGK